MALKWKNLFSSGRDHSFHKNHPTWRGVAVQVGQLFLLVKSELVMIGTPLLRNPMTESYVPGSWLWRMVLVLPLVVIFTTYAVSIMEVKRIFKHNLKEKHETYIFYNIFKNLLSHVNFWKGNKGCCGSRNSNYGEFYDMFLTTRYYLKKICVMKQGSHQKPIE